MAPKYTNKLHDKRVLIIGGTAGIGYAVAEGAVEFGAHVTVASSKQENVNNAVKKLKESYPEASNRIQGHICNINSDECEANLTKAMDFATDNKSTKLDHIVDTAGAPPIPIKLETAEPSQIHTFIQARLVPKILLAKLARIYLNDSYTSSVTFTGGSLSYKPTKGFGVMASMVGHDSLVKGFAMDLAPIRVNLVAPGAIHTSLLEKFAPDGNVQGLLDRFTNASLVGRVGSTEEIAESYLAILKNTFQTGTVSLSDGGYVLT